MRILSQASKAIQPVRLAKRWAVLTRLDSQTLEATHSSCTMPSSRSNLLQQDNHHGPNYISLRPFSASLTEIQNRCFSNVSRSFPSYSVLGEHCLFSMKPILPKFKHSQGPSNGSNGISLLQKGRMLLEFSPKNQGNQKGFQWNEKISFALTVEEMGLLLSQLPHYSVTLSRRIGGGESSNGVVGGAAPFKRISASTYEFVSTGTDTFTNEYVDKVLTVEPGEGATLTFQIDYRKDGVGGQKAPAFVSNETSNSAPLHVVLEAGEWEVISTLFRDSIPHLLGWNQMMNIGVHNVMNDRGGGGEDGFF